MRFSETNINGAYLIEMEPHEDERGYFARTRCDEEFAALGLNNQLSECSVSSNTVRGTLRGMHYQTAPHEEIKLVTCLRGQIFDALVDLRRDSPTYLKTFSAELSLENMNALYVPAGVAHGFLTLVDESYVQYQIAGSYEASAAHGVRWNDPALNIDWPFTPSVISDRDQAYKDYAS